MAAVATRLGLDWGTIRTLLFLRGRLTLRQFARERGRIIGAVITISIFGPIVIGAAIGTVVGYRLLELEQSALILFGVLVVLWLIWLSFPILFSSINEGLDITRLLIYPVSQRDMIAATLLSPIFDYPTYLVLPLFIAVLAGYGWSLAVPVIVIALLLAFFHMVIIGQLVLTVIGGLLQTRRFRDFIVVGAALLGSSCYLIQVGVQQLFEASSIDITALAFSLPTYLRWLPTGAAAQSMVDALSGRWGSSILWLGYSIVLLVVLVAIWFRLITRITTGQGFLINVRPREEKKEQPAAVRRSSQSPWAALLAILPADVAQLFTNELRSFWRIPQRRVGMAQGIIMPVILFVSFTFGVDDGGSSIFERAGLILPPYALFLFWILGQNMLAWEGSGLGMLLLTPVPRQRIFLAKGLALMLVTGGMYLLAGIVLLALNPGWLTAVGLLTGLGIGLAALAVLAVASVLFPVPVATESKQPNSTSKRRGGIVATLGAIFLVPLALMLVTLPAGLPLAAAAFFELPWVGYLGVLFALGYGGVIFWYGTRWAGDLLLRRETEILKALRLAENEQK